MPADHVEQPMPTPNGRTSIQSLVRADLEQRELVGIERYGTPLQPHNGRDALRDLYEELLDGACYARQAMEERARPAESHAATTGDAEAPAIPDSVIRAVLEKVGWPDERQTFVDGREIPGYWDVAADVARAAIEAWEAYQALPKITVDFDHDDGYLWWWVCSLATCPGFRGGHGTEADARAAGDAHLAATHAAPKLATGGIIRDPVPLLSERDGCELILPQRTDSDPDPARYRVGNHNPHLIYLGSSRRADDEQFLAACQTADIAAELVTLLNGADPTAVGM